jgi:hypothetical protein
MSQQQKLVYFALKRHSNSYLPNLRLLAEPTKIVLQCIFNLQALANAINLVLCMCPIH